MVLRWHLRQRRRDGPQSRRQASYDEWGDGLWALADKGKRLVLIVEDISEEADRRKVATLVEFKITRGTGGTLVLTRLSDSAKINAVKCKPN